MSNYLKGNQVQWGNPYQVKPNYSIPVIRRRPTEESFSGDGTELDENSDESIDRKKEELELLIKEANLEAENIIKSAIEEAENIKRKSYEEGYHDGLVKGEEEVKLKYESIMLEAEQNLEQTKMQHEEMLNGMEGEVVELALAVARRIVSYELEIHPEFVLKLLRNTLDNTSNKDNITIKVSDEDYQYLNQHADEVNEMLSDVKDYEIRVSRNLEKGDIEIESPQGSIEAGINTQFENVEEAFSDLLPERIPLEDED